MISESTNDAVILIIANGEQIKVQMAKLLEAPYSCLTADSTQSALELLKAHRPAVVISDIRLLNAPGFELIPSIEEHSPDTVLVVIGEQPLKESFDAMEMKKVFDFITIPIQPSQAEMAIRRAVKHHELLAAKRAYEARLQDLADARTGQHEYLAYNDELTGLPNRAMLIDRLTRFLSKAAEGTSVGVLVIAPERFRDVRNALGQESADRLFAEFAERLRAICSTNAILARTDTDELTAVLPALDSKGAVDVFVERIADALQRPLTVGGRRIFLTASVGIGIYPEDGSDAPTILRNAGAALTHARRHGTRREYFDQSMQEAAMRRLLVEHDLRHALARGELAVHYQPKIANLTGKITGFEALARWHHPAGDIEPSEFIPVAEASGSILELGEWVLNESCLAAARWHREGHDLKIAVNVSAAQFDTELIEVVERAISHSGIDPERLELEVTESSIMTSASAAIELIRDLKKTGLQIAIDDFGTGYSSLGQLRRLPIDILKIDRSFVADVTSNADDASLIMGIISLAHNLNLKVVAEGVETAEQLRFLKLVKCDEWQGFLASRPLPADDVAELLASNPSYSA